MRIFFSHTVYLMFTQLLFWTHTYHSRKMASLIFVVVNFQYCQVIKSILLLFTLSAMTRILDCSLQGSQFTEYFYQSFTKRKSAKKRYFKIRQISWCCVLPLRQHYENKIYKFVSQRSGRLCLWIISWLWSSQIYCIL